MGRSNINSRKGKQHRKARGGGIITPAKCNSQVDIDRYTKPCAEGNPHNLDYLFNKHFKHEGGGFSVLPDNIGNMATYQGYSDCCPPVLTKDGMIFSTNFQPICGQKGGAKKRKVHKKSKSKSRKSKRRTHKPKRNVSRSTRSKRGGGYMEVKDMKGDNGNFSADMNKREFGCRQPSWNPNCI